MSDTITPEEYQAMLAGRSRRKRSGPRDNSVRIPAPNRAQYKRGEPNKLEQAYGRHLEMRKLAGEILDYRFEAIKIDLGDRCTYTPDFMVILANGAVEFHEVKGFWEEDARIKIKWASDKYPYFHFVGVQRRKGDWIYEHFRGPR